MTQQMAADHAVGSTQTQGQECKVVVWMELSLLTRADAPSQGRALASGVAGNLWVIPCTIGLSQLMNNRAVPFLSKRQEGYPSHLTGSSIIADLSLLTQTVTV